MMLSQSEADELAKKIALDSIGFGPTTGQVTIDVAEIIKVAERAAWKALETAGVIKK